MNTAYKLPSQTAPTPLAAGFLVHVLAAAISVAIVLRVVLAVVCV